METLSFSLIFILTILFLFLTFAFLYNIYIDVFKTKMNVKKTQLKNKWICRKIRWKGKLFRYNKLIWLYPKQIALAVFIGFLIELFLIILNTLVSLILAFVFFLIYMWFIKFLYDRYYEFPKIIAQKLKEHEDAIESAIKKNVESKTAQTHPTDSHYEIFKYAKGVAKVEEYPPFIDLPPEKRSVIKERTMQFVVLANDFLLACLNPTPFNLLKPAREEPKKQCALIRKPGACKEVYYSQIKTAVYKDEHVNIIFWDEKEEPIRVLIKKAPDAKKLVDAIREKLRITERKRMGKHDFNAINIDTISLKKLEILESSQDKENIKEKLSSQDESNKKVKEEPKEEKKS